MTETVMQVVLPRRVVPQPTPNLYPGGDCGPCVLAGVLGKTVQEVYDQFSSGKYKSFHFSEMCGALHSAEAYGMIDRVVTDIPIWPWAGSAEAFCAWGIPSTLQNLAWFAYVTMAMDAGYYCLAMVDTKKGGAHGEGTNHWVLLVGVRELRIPIDERSARISTEVLVSCSSRTTPDEEWVEASTFLKERGGFNLILARPAP